MSKKKKIVLTVLLGLLILLSIYQIALYGVAIINLVLRINPSKWIDSGGVYMEIAHIYFMRQLPVDIFRYSVTLVLLFSSNVFYIIFLLRLWNKEIHFSKYSYEDYKLKRKEERKAKLMSKIEDLENDKDKLKKEIEKLN